MSGILDEILAVKESECSGCGACRAICGRQAIALQENEDGFLLPQIDRTRCVGCGMCKRVCPYVSAPKQSEPIDAYAAVESSREEKMKSASGGVFWSVAKEFLRSGGTVFGAVLFFENGVPEVKHCEAALPEQLEKMRGSKYVQSDMTDCFATIKNELCANRKVLFSGTPCQVAGLKNYLQGNDEGLFTIDIICHGVPSQKLFREYMAMLAEKYKGTPSAFSFRDKRAGWGMTARLEMTDGRTRRIASECSTYFDNFLEGTVYRKSCYTCPYARKSRVGDITIGDYWGVAALQPDVLENEGFEESGGISCVLVNTLRGKALLEECGKTLQTVPSGFAQISKENHQLVRPSTDSGKRDFVLMTDRQDGIAALQKMTDKKYGSKKIYYQIKANLPGGVKKALKKLRK